MCAATVLQLHMPPVCLWTLQVAGAPLAAGLLMTGMSCSLCLSTLWRFVFFLNLCFRAGLLHVLLSHVTHPFSSPSLVRAADGLLALRGWQWLFILEGRLFFQLHAHLRRQCTSALLVH